MAIPMESDATPDGDSNRDGNSSDGVALGPAPRDESASGRRRYDSPVRRGRAAETRERIVTAGSALVHGFPTWDWSGLTFRAVADRAGVSERTVYRHFATERQLHDAVMRRLEEEAGLSYDQLRLADLPDLTRRVLASLSSFEVWRGVTEHPRPPFATEDERRRAALLRAVTEVAPAPWSDEERRQAAAAIDVLWNLPTFERLIAGWGLDVDQATTTVTWAIGLLIDAVRGRPPAAPPTGAAQAGAAQAGGRSGPP
ncbi:transcriptional regulator [Frankia sp. EI5c]|uniref:TetR/AcrR family transcriptional regulator n=1 Tax=Frankia sp. EI5c TaxID=683316 RepID=UPI0007C30D86|nr:TetR/AcrR family transcriptional regulator [Frankia sp. EI5c]OAA27450.1 transcriptional regulator [Frankia sp. EI5c]